MALPKSGKNPESPKSYRPISLLCTSNKLLERLILTRFQSVIEGEFVHQQADFRPGKLCCSHVLNLTHHIKLSYERNKIITGAAFMDLMAAYDTINHGILIKKLFEINDDVVDKIPSDHVLSNRRFMVELNEKKSHWQSQRNCLLQGLVLSYSMSTQMISHYNSQRKVSCIQTIYA